MNRQNIVVSGTILVGTLGAAITAGIVILVYNMDIVSLQLDEVIVIIPQSILIGVVVGYGFYKNAGKLLERSKTP
jgi:hypothetical protein